MDPTRTFIVNGPAISWHIAFVFIQVNLRFDVNASMHLNCIYIWVFVELYIWADFDVTEWLKWPIFPVVHVCHFYYSFLIIVRAHSSRPME